MTQPPQKPSVESMLDRRHLLDRNHGNVLEAMRESGLPDPVGFIIDAIDFQGRQFAIQMRRAAGTSEEEATRQIDETNAVFLRNRMTPTLITVTSVEAARAILPLTSPTALQTLKTREAQREPGHCLVTVIASGGNTYASVELSLAPDGNNRTSTKGL